MTITSSIKGAAGAFYTFGQRARDARDAVGRFFRWNCTRRPAETARAQAPTIKFRPETSTTYKTTRRISGGGDALRGGCAGNGVDGSGSQRVGSTPVVAPPPAEGAAARMPEWQNGRMAEWHAEADRLQKQADKLAIDVEFNQLPKVDFSKKHSAGPYFEVVKEVCDRLERVLISQNEYALFLQSIGVTPEMAKLCASVDYLESIHNELNIMCEDLNKNAYKIWNNDQFKEILVIYEHHLIYASLICNHASNNILNIIKSADAEDADLQQLTITGLLDPRIQKEIGRCANANNIKPVDFFNALRGRLDVAKAKVPAVAGESRVVFHVATNDNPIEFDQRDVEIMKVEGKIAWYALQTRDNWPLD